MKRERIETLPLFPLVNRALVELLEQLTPEQWRKPTVHGHRDVKDLVAHLLDGTLRRLALQRDGWGPEPQSFASHQEVIDFIQGVNREWMGAARRLSPRILVELVKRYDAELCELFAGLDPEATALFPVAWAGETVSVNWFDVAREYTEKWHHQQQIRDAVGAPALDDPALMRPVLRTFLCALPHAYRELVAADGQTIQVDLEGPAGCVATLERRDGVWLSRDPIGEPSVRLRVAQDYAWRIFTKTWSPVEALAHLQIEGDATLAPPLAAMVCVMA